MDARLVRSALLLLRRRSLTGPRTSSGTFHRVATCQRRNRFEHHTLRDSHLSRAPRPPRITVTRGRSDQEKRRLKAYRREHTARRDTDTNAPRRTMDQLRLPQRYRASRSALELGGGGMTGVRRLGTLLVGGALGSMRSTVIVNDRRDRESS